ncbi:DUF58 domain-containing protein [Massilia forsythiae]|uniref:DUF58 domain-containing protein n=1 Tax=Massilia forsythiae TaxID=2728020 RepID=A0A7Z2ZS99_9BURK|nr:DUF58 domain-containing protein [Massilia forsythiae]QJD98826.1 DUF58 domain-containing protein [Massilia forsythiae]
MARTAGPARSEAAPARPAPAWLAAARSRWRARATAQDAGEVVLGQRRVYILPTGAGLGFAALLLVLLVGSINYNLGLGYALTFVAAACAVVDMVGTWRNLAHLRLRAGRAPDVFAGADVPFALHVANRTRLDRYAVWIDADDVPAPRHPFDVAAGGSAAPVLAAAAAQRGWRAAPRMRLSTRFPLGLFRAWSYWQPDSRALVYPRPEQDAPPLPYDRWPDPDGAGNGGSDDFGGVRSYQPGDPLRHLAWRQIARLDPALGGQLLTKHFEGGASEMLVLDFGALPAQLDLESRLSRMTRWVLDAEARALPYAFRLGAVEYDSALGAAHQAACLRALALYGLGGEHAGPGGADQGAAP